MWLLCDEPRATTGLSYACGTSFVRELLFLPIDAGLHHSIEWLYSIPLDVYGPYFNQLLRDGCLDYFQFRTTVNTNK